MAYQLEFGDLAQYAGMFASGAATTLALTAVSTALGVTVGVLGAAGRDSKLAWVRSMIGAYVEAIRNTPSIVQLFFVFFGLPALGIHLSEYIAAVLTMMRTEDVCIPTALTEVGPNDDRAMPFDESWSARRLPGSLACRPASEYSATQEEQACHCGLKCLG